MRWVNVPAEHTISWSVQPHKKSINFGIFKHPGTGNSVTPSLPTSSSYELPTTPNPEASSRSRSKSISRNETSTAVEKLRSIGLACASWYGKCEADKVAMGKYDVPSDQGGMYALVFDNTFSKQISKTATFVLLTYPTNVPPPSSHYLHNSQVTGSTTSLGSRSPRMLSQRTDSMDTLPLTSEDRPTIASFRPNSSNGAEVNQGANFNSYTGILRKRRRKRHQGWARRFFSLDFTSSTLSYYHSRHSFALRGAIPLSLAAVGANEENKEISIDSGAEVWHLRASNLKIFRGWADALEKASRTIISASTSTPGATLDDSGPSRPPVNSFVEKEWGRVESIVGRISGIRDAVRRLAKDTDPKYLTPPLGLGISPSPPPSDSPNGSITGESINEEERRPFWRRKSSNNRTGPATASFRRTISGQFSAPTSTRTDSPNKGALPAVQEPFPAHQGENGMHGHCMALLHDLDSVVADCVALITESKQRRRPPINSRLSRQSIDSTASQEFFDADEGNPNRSQLLTIRRDSDDEVAVAEDDAYDSADSASCSDIEEAESLPHSPVVDGNGSSLFPSRAKSLTPLPMDPIRRRKTVPASTVLPPSLIGFLRKNVGKDLSTISMPVSANEPTSLLQRISEQLEYSSLLEAALSAQAENGERLLYVTAFAVSHLSNARVKERSIRKPFNPMLGETYELVREDLGFRFVAEKVSHRPVCIACQAEAKNWTLTQSPMPTQKFWGKSAELITDGRIRISLHATGDCYSWTTATCFLRNIIAGEKYVEPVNTMTVLNETTGEKAIVTFKVKGMFSGRSEEVLVQAFGPHGNELPLGLTGKWTSSLTITDHGSPSKTIWEVGDLVENAPTHYGLTTFAASLNEITALEENCIPKTDSRLRPDQRAAENGDLEKAEALKIKLEEGQRARRKVLDAEGVEWKPRWFNRVSGAGDGEEVWALRTGKDGYWESRARGDWEGVVDVFDV